MILTNSFFIAWVFQQIVSVSWRASLLSDFCLVLILSLYIIWILFWQGKVNLSQKELK